MQIESFLQDAGVQYVKHDHPVAYTAQEMAAEEHVSGDAVAKPVLVEADGRRILAVLPASCKVDLGKLAEAVGARNCRLVDEQEMAGVFPDVEVGAEPPFGEPYGLETVVDQRLAGQEQVTFAAGTHRQSIVMPWSEYARLAGARQADFAVHL
jgi:Ala-tRNA(Pro) deacylase